MAQWFIQEFSKISNITMRTLRHYDDIGLLKPSVRLPNGYRLYSEADLLRLQQIIALKFFGFKLSQVQTLIHEDLSALNHFRAQQLTIKNQIAQLENAHQTLDDLVHSLQSNGSIHWDKIIQLIEDYRMTKETKMVWGPNQDKQKQQEYQKELVDLGLATQAQIEEVNLKAKDWKPEKVESIKNEQKALLKALATLMIQQRDPSDPEVQLQIRKHVETIKNFWSPTKEGYIKLAEFYSTSPDFKKFISAIDPNLTSFLAKAMIVFAERELP